MCASCGTQSARHDEQDSTAFRKQTSFWVKQMENDKLSSQERVTAVKQLAILQDPASVLPMCRQLRTFGRDILTREILTTLATIGDRRALPTLMKMKEFLEHEATGNWSPIPRLLDVAIEKCGGGMENRASG